MKIVDVFAHASTLPGPNYNWAGQQQRNGSRHDGRSSYKVDNYSREYPAWHNSCLIVFILLFNLARQKFDIPAKVLPSFSYKEPLTFAEGSSRLNAYACVPFEHCVPHRRDGIVHPNLFLT